MFWLKLTTKDARPAFLLESCKSMPEANWELTDVTTVVVHCPTDSTRSRLHAQTVGFVLFMPDFAGYASPFMVMYEQGVLAVSTIKGERYSDIQWQSTSGDIGCAFIWKAHHCKFNS